MFKKAAAFLFLLIIFCFPSVHAHGHQIPTNWWNHEIQLASNPNITLRWNNLDSEHIIMEVSAMSSSTDYVGIGFSRHAQMEGADMVLAFMDNGVLQLKDTHAEGYLVPVEDSVANYDLISGSYMSGVMTIRFRRRYNTCDKEDLLLSEDTVHILWAIGSLTLDDMDNMSVPRPEYHHRTRGSRPMLLKPNGVGYVPIPSASDRDQSTFWDFQPRSLINGEATVYACGIIKIPHSLTAKTYIVGFEPLLGPEDGYRVHHMLLFGCTNVTIVNETRGDRILDKYIDQPSRDFFGDEIPPEWFKICTRFELVWTIGSEGFMLPPDMGIPLDEKNGGFSYILYQIHYDNPGRKILTDNTGGRFYLTQNGRNANQQKPQYDSAIFSVAHRVSIFHLIPPHSPKHTVRAFCPSACSSSMFPSDGVTVTSVLLHAHETSVGMRMRHFRDGTELPPLAVDENYEPTYQEYRAVYPRRKIYPGDELVVECTYNTSARAQVTLGGIEAVTEMCVGFVQYFPRSPFYYTTSQPEFYSYFRELEIDGNAVQSAPLREAGWPYIPGVGKSMPNPIDEIVPFRRYSSSIGYRDGLGFVKVDSNTTLAQVFEKYDWESLESGAPLDNRLYNKEQDVLCVLSTLTEFKTVKPNIEEFRNIKEDSCKNR